MKRISIDTICMIVVACTSTYSGIDYVMKSDVNGALWAFSTLVWVGIAAIKESQIKRLTGMITKYTDNEISSK
jgi:hypothetical protein